MAKREAGPSSPPTAPQITAAPHRRGAPSSGAGRYDNLKSARVPAAGFGTMPPSTNRDQVVAAVVDPMDDGRERHLVHVNRRVDVLEQERSHARISEAAYLTGRILQAVFERGSRIGSSNFEGGSRRDPREVRIYLMARRLCDAREMRALEERLRGRIGERNVRVLRRILGDVASFADAAALEGKAGPRGTSFIAETFRLALEDAVAAVQEARGATPPAPNDSHRAAGDGMAAREIASIRAGTTLARLEEDLAVAQRTGQFSDGSPAGRGAIAVLEVEIQHVALRRTKVLKAIT